MVDVGNCLLLLPPLTLLNRLSFALTMPPALLPTLPPPLPPSALADTPWEAAAAFSAAKSRPRTRFCLGCLALRLTRDAPFPTATADENAAAARLKLLLPVQG